MPLWQAMQVRDAVRALGADRSYGENRRPNRQELGQSAVMGMRQAAARRSFMEASAVASWLACPWPKTADTDIGDIGDIEET